ncbi:unnamed protein product [Fusarium graminearum]|nr:unnamed protein product [Fusarium graminearum]CAF3628438.1 unnamed protein product [Fusarium graminearum]CAG2018003.1 unnamed protein product [Fusarium graminearum]
MTMDSLSVPSLRISKARLATLLHESCQFSATQQWGKTQRDPTETGMARITLSDSEQLVRDWFMGYATSLGCRNSERVIRLRKRRNQTSFADRPRLNFTVNSSPGLDDFLLSLERHYTSGEFADAVITCKGQVFNIHSRLVSSFQVLCEGTGRKLEGLYLHKSRELATDIIQESIERKIEIKDFDLIIVGAMLCFVYTFDYDEPSDDKSMLFHAEVYKFADMYDIPALKECSKKKFASAMNADWNTDDFPYAISEVYKNTPLEDRGLRDLAVAITREHIKTLIGRDDFSRLLRKTADLSADLIPFLCGGTSGDGFQMAHGHPQGRDVCPNCLQPKRIVLDAAHFGAGYINALPRCYCT